MDENDSDAKEMRRLTQQQEREYASSDDEEKKSASEDEDDEEMGESEGDEEDVEMINPSDSEASDADEPKQKKKSGKKALRAQLELEKTIRQKEAQMRSADGAQPTSVNDFERMLVADYDQSYLWI